MRFGNIYDGHEKATIYVGDMKVVPKYDRDLTSWMAIVTYFNEEEERGGISSDVVYIANPQVRVIVRMKAMVKELDVEVTR